MTLAQVVYNISNDQEFAEMWQSDPETALANRGLKLSKEEKAFLVMGLKDYKADPNGKVSMAHAGVDWGGWVWW